jgi:ribose transport system permease protein
MTAATEERGGRGALRERLSEVISQLAAAGALIVVFVFLSFASPVFLSADNLFNIGSQTAVVAVIAIGMTLVIITAGIDLSVGSVSALSGVLGVMLMAQAGLPVPVAILGGTLVGATCGLVNGLLVSVAGLNPFIATLGMLTVARGLTFIFTNAVAVFGAPSSFRLLGQGVIGPIPIPILTIVVMAVIGYIVLEAARLSGIPIRRYLTSVYVISGALAGFGGMIAASRVNSGQPNFGIGLELDVIAAAVIGGASLFGGQGTVVGTLIGAFLIALIRNGAVLLDVNTFYQQVIIGVVIWLAVFWDQYRRRRLAAASE